MPDLPPLHPEAQKALDARATALTQMLERNAAPPTHPSPKLVGSAAHVPVRHHLKAEDVLEPIRVVEGRDPTTGELVELTIRHDDILYKLGREGTTALRKLVSDAAFRPELRDVCDSQFVQDSLVRWLDTSARTGSPTMPWVSALTDALRGAAQETTFRVPLAGIAIEQPFGLGPWKVTYFSREDIDALVARRPEEHRQAVRQKYERDFQGKVCVEGSAVAVPSRVRSLAIEAAENVVCALRFVHQASFDIATRCAIDLYGRTPTPTVHAMLTIGSQTFMSAAVDDARQADDAFLSVQQMPLFNAAGLTAAGGFLATKSPSKLQEAAWVGLEIFTHGISSHLWRERLIGALVSAESLLLANSNEPIQKSLGQRMARLLGRTLEERKQIVQDLKQAYDARSAFVHHGQDIEASERQVLNRVMSACRAVVQSCLAAGWFRTREELISHLDDLLMA